MGLRRFLAAIMKMPLRVVNIQGDIRRLNKPQHAAMTLDERKMSMGFKPSNGQDRLKALDASVKQCIMRQFNDGYQNADVGKRD